MMPKDPTRKVYIFTYSMPALLAIKKKKQPNKPIPQNNTFQC